MNLDPEVIMDAARQLATAARLARRLAAALAPPAASSTALTKMQTECLANIRAAVARLEN